jgi:hypothetical protein
MNNILLSKIARDSVTYTEVQARGFGRIAIAIDQFKQVIQSHFAVKAKCSYFFKKRSKL